MNHIIPKIKSLTLSGIIIFLLWGVGGLWLFSSCSDDNLNPKSVIVVSQTEKNAFDHWLDYNYLYPYNIQFKYRYEEIESDYNYYTVPADMNQAIELAHLVKYICVDSYSEVAGEDFTRENFPKEFYLIGEWEYNNNGTYILGTAEGGKKILLTGVNYVDKHKNSLYELNYYYLKTIHHEFTHILNQTKPMPTDFQYVTKEDYLADSWSTSEYSASTYYLPHGFISAYAQKEYKEDFAEMMSMYICYPQSQWDAWLAAAGTDGAAKIDSKLNIVKRYMNESWGIDLDQLRSVIQRRESEIEAGKIDLTDITVE